MCDVAYQALSLLMQQWEGPGDKTDPDQTRSAATMQTGSTSSLTRIDLVETGSGPEAAQIWPEQWPYQTHRFPKFAFREILLQGQGSNIT